MVSDAAKKKAAAKKAALQKKISTKNVREPAVTQEPEISNALAAISQEGHKLEATEKRHSRIEFPSTLSARDRAILHDFAEQNNLKHESFGSEDCRKLVLSSAEFVVENKQLIIPDEDELTAAQICTLIAEAFGIDASLTLLEKLENKNRIEAQGVSSPVPSSNFGGFGEDVIQISLEEFVTKTGPLISLEKDAEMAASTEAAKLLKPETAQRKGFTLLNLKCASMESGLMGKTLLELKPNRSELLPPHRFTPHDVVALKPNKADSSSSPIGQGVVYRVKDTAIIVAMEDVPEDGMDAPLRLEKLTNDVTYNRMKDTVAELSKPSHHGPAANLIKVLFGLSPPRTNPALPPVTPFNRNLDPSQLAAVQRCLGSADVMLVHGPPGTGKTTTLIEVILQEVTRGSRVLVCASSNMAVDNLVDRLAGARLRGSASVPLVRLGHPARLMPSVLNHSLDALVLKTDNSALAADVRRELKDLHVQLSKCKWRRERVPIQREVRRLSREETKRQKTAVDDVIKGAKVVLCTLTGAANRLLQGSVFDLVVVDEAAQCVEVSCWTALLRAPRCVLAGDHLQLGPTVQSKQAEAGGLGLTLFHRLAGLLGPQSVALLTVQYRMHRAIMEWASQEMYSGLLTAHASVATGTLPDLPGFKALPALSLASLAPLLLIDSAGCELYEVEGEDGGSYQSEGEAEVAMEHVKRLLQCGLSADAIGVIAPYRAQVGLLKELRCKESTLLGVEISTVDGFQGREKEAIVISMVRSNDKREVGFLADSRRMNVAVTRAKRHCCIICDSETVSNDAFLGRMVSYFEEHGEIQSAMEFLS